MGRSTKKSVKVMRQPGATEGVVMLVLIVLAIISGLTFPNKLFSIFGYAAIYLGLFYGVFEHAYR